MKGLLSPAETLPSLLGDVLSANKEKRFVQRILSPESGNSIPTEGGLLQTHFMRAEMDEDGRAWAFPMTTGSNLVPTKGCTAMNTETLASCDEKLNRHLRLNTFPVAVRFLRSWDEAPERAKRPLKDLGNRLTTCQAVSLSRRYGWAIGYQAIR